jgi:hypothetical protein
MSALLAEWEARGLRQVVAVIGDSANFVLIGLHGLLLRHALLPLALRPRDRDQPTPPPTGVL